LQEDEEVVAEHGLHGGFAQIGDLFRFVERRRTLFIGHPSKIARPDFAEALTWSPLTKWSDDAVC
jgi:hypothetical protein